MAEDRSGSHAPIHASWLNQIEVYFSVLQRKLLTPSDLEDLADLKQGLISINSELRGPGYCGDVARYQHHGWKGLRGNERDRDTDTGRRDPTFGRRARV
jgi:hypothetical protein